MADYNALYRQLWQAILQADGQIGNDMTAFVQRFLDVLHQSRQGVVNPSVPATDAYVRKALSDLALDPELEKELTAYLDEATKQLKSLITASVALGAAGMGSEAVKKQVAQAYSRRWPDGLRLSDRVWHYQEQVRTGLTDVLKNSIRQQYASSKIIYQMQRLVERTPGHRRFELVGSHGAQWVEKLANVAKGTIHTPEAQVLWQNTQADVEDYIQKLAKTGTRHASTQLLNQVRKAVAKGQAGLVDKAVKWWLYDKQLYHFKRIARTEMATAAHRAVIASTKEDSDIIGYQWRLSSSHPKPDICDYYANIEMGLGKGVWSKDSVPEHKAHPHCQCLLLPRVSQIKQKGSQDYPAFIENADEKLRAQLLPKWVKSALAEGVSLKKLIRKDGLGLIKKQDAVGILDHHVASNIFNRLLSQPDVSHLASFWVNPDKYRTHVNKRIKMGHIVNESDYFQQVKRVLQSANGYYVARGKYTLIEVFNNDWAVVLTRQGLVKTAYALEPSAESFVSRQTRLGYQVNDYKFKETLRRQFKNLFR